MSFRTRLTVTFLLAVLVPVTALTLLIRSEMAERIREQYLRRVDSQLEVIEGDLEENNRLIASALDQVCRDIERDTRFRKAAVDRESPFSRYMLDYAAEAMNLAGLDLLQIQEGTGRIISSGNFRNEYGRMEPELVRLLGVVGSGYSLIEARTPGSQFLAMARADSVFISGKKLTVTGGIRIGTEFLKRISRSGQIEIEVRYPGGVLSTGGVQGQGEDRGRVFRKLELPFADSEKGELASADFVVSHRLDALDSILRGINRWFLIVLLTAAAVSVAIMSWMARTVSRPLEELAGKASRLDLDNLEIDFETGRGDEIGKLSAVLGSMAERLKKSSARIRDAERRATLGEMARQVNHDIKNGLAPIRNIFRHFSQLAGKDRMELGRAFVERRGSLEKSINYLEELATGYARLTPAVEKRRLEVNGVVRESLRIIEGDEGIRLKLDLGRDAEITGDPIALQRVMENLLKNGRDALGPGGGEISVSTEVLETACGAPSVVITVSDNGEGMSAEQRGRIFENFYTTRDEGTGLGLSIVQRLVRDLGGSVTVESEEGRGSSFTLKLPLEGER